MASLPLPLLLFSISFSSFFFFFVFPLQAAVVTHLPGFQGALPFYLETGYVEVDEVNGGEYFYYFIRSESNPAEDPLLLWLTGGPRCSAFSGLIFEIGPLKFVTAKYNGSLPSLTYFPTSWTKVANIIFLDSPLGSGFSFAKNYEGYNTNDSYWSRQSHTFLLKWFDEHPQFLSNPLYVAGDSYAGKIVPIIAQEVLNGILISAKPYLSVASVLIKTFDNIDVSGIDAKIQPHINLKGYITGNPGTGELIDVNSRVPYARDMRIISDNFLKLTQGSCKGQDYDKPTKKRCAMYLDTFNNFLSEINKAHILEPKCISEFDLPINENENRRILKEKLNLLKQPPFPDLRCRNYAGTLSYYWANHHSVRKALRIREGSVPEWIRCERNLPFTKDIKSSLKYHFNLLARGYRALVYSGDHDMVIPLLGTQTWIKLLNSTIIEDWRSWYVDGQVAGYATSYDNNLTFITVKGAGHTAPEYKPKECLAMFKRWISYLPI